MITRKTKLALKKYGIVLCVRAYRLNEVDGLGANSIGIELGLTTRQADSAIDAGREFTARCTTPVSTTDRFSDPAYIKREREINRAQKSIRSNVK